SDVCSSDLSCHLINAVAEAAAPPPTFKLQPGKVLYGPYADPEENLVHPAKQSDLYRGANYCAACHFDKVKDVTRRDLPGEILQGTIARTATWNLRPAVRPQSEEP